MARVTAREPEGDWRGFDEYDVIDSPSASFELERLLDEAAAGCREEVAGLTGLLDRAHDDLAAGRLSEGVAGLREFGRRVEQLWEEGRLAADCAGDVLSLVAAAVEWATETGAAMTDDGDTG